MAIYDLTEQDFDVADAAIAIVAARFNAHVVDPLLDGALAALARHGIHSDGVLQVRVPGAFELPLAARVIGKHDNIEAVIALGCVIRGDTPHFDYVCTEAARGIADAAAALDKPIIFGVLTTDDQAQADARCGGAHGNKGEEAALAALEMVALLRQLRAS